MARRRLPSYFTVAEIAEMCKCSKRTVMRWIEAGLPAHKIGSSWLIVEADFYEYMEHRTEEAKKDHHRNRTITAEQINKPEE